MAGKVVLITGASAGIGAAVAELLASQSHSVVLVARRAEALGEVAARCGRENSLVVVADCTKREDVGFGPNPTAAITSINTTDQCAVWFEPCAMQSICVSRKRVFLGTGLYMLPFTLGPCTAWCA